MSSFFRTDLIINRILFLTYQTDCATQEEHYDIVITGKKNLRKYNKHRQRSLSEDNIKMK